MHAVLHLQFISDARLFRHEVRGDNECGENYTVRSFIIGAANKMLFGPTNLGGSCGTQEILRLLWKLEVRYRTHESPPPVQANPTDDVSFQSILILLSHLRLSRPSHLLLFDVRSH